MHSVMYHKFKNIPLYHSAKKYFLYLIIAFCIAFKDWAGVYIMNNGNFVMLPMFCLFIYLIMYLLPEYIQKLKSIRAKKLMYLFFFCFAYSYFMKIYMENYIWIWTRILE